MASGSGASRQIPRLLYPAEASVVDGSAVTFEWTGIPEAREYRFQLARDPGFEDIEMDAEVGSSTVLTLYDLIPSGDGQFCWRVAALASGRVVFSEHRSIEVILQEAQASPQAEDTTEEPVDRTVPRPVFPCAGEVTDGLATTFEWHPAESAANYRFQVAEDQDFENVILETNVGNTNSLTLYDTLPLDGPELAWRVGANVGSEPKWSLPSTFAAVSDLSERIKQTARSAQQPLTAAVGQVSDTSVTGVAVADQSGAMRLVFIWLFLTTALTLLILLKILLTGQ